jgi:hypothetical protein
VIEVEYLKYNIGDLVFSVDNDRQGNEYSVIGVISDIKDGAYQVYWSDGFALDELYDERRITMFREELLSRVI